MSPTRTLFAGGLVFDGTGSEPASMRATLATPLDVSTLVDRIERVYQDGKLVHHRDEGT